MKENVFGAIIYICNIFFYKIRVLRRSMLGLGCGYIERFGFYLCTGLCMSWDQYYRGEEGERMQEDRDSVNKEEIYIYEGKVKTPSFSKKLNCTSTERGYVL